MQFQLACYFLRCRRMYIECSGEKMVGGTFGDICGVSDIRQRDFIKFPDEQ
jgi:hypothetical protein